MADDQPHKVRPIKKAKVCRNMASTACACTCSGGAGNPKVWSRKVRVKTRQETTRGYPSLVMEEVKLAGNSLPIFSTVLALWKLAKSTLAGKSGSSAIGACRGGLWAFTYRMKAFRGSQDLFPVVCVGKDSQQEGSPWDSLGKENLYSCITCPRSNCIYHLEYMIFRKNHKPPGPPHPWEPRR